MFPPSLDEYKKSFEHAKDNILAGNSYLTYLTCQANVEYNLSLRDIFLQANHRRKNAVLGKSSCPKDDMTFYKARVVYGTQGVESIGYAPYTMREIRSLQVVACDDIDYTYKSCVRTALNHLVARKGNSDEIIIVKNGLIADTSFTNIAIFDGKNWLTPKHPLLKGTKRAALLEQGMLQDGDITTADLKAAKKVCLFNAMIEFGERVVSTNDVHEPNLR